MSESDTPSPNDEQESPFDSFINRHLDMDGLDHPDDAHLNDSLKDKNPDWGLFNQDPLFRINKRTVPSVMPLPPVNDSRWQCGIYRSFRPVDIYRSPNPPHIVTHRLGKTGRLSGHKIRFIPNIAPGWSAVQISSTVTGYVRNKDIMLYNSNWLRDHWIEILLISGILTVILLGIVEEIDTNQQLDMLRTTISVQETQINSLQATLAAKD